MHLRRLVAVVAAFLLLAGFAPAAMASAPADTTPPALDLVVPRVTNVTEFPIMGTTEPGARVLINGTAVAVRADGLFTVKASVKTTGSFVVTAVDAAGNKTERTRTVTYSGVVPDHATSPVVGLTGPAMPGTLVTNLLDKSWVGTRADAASTWRVFWDTLKPGYNELLLQFTQPTGVSWVEYYRVWVPFAIMLPRITNEKGLTYTGLTLPGWTVTMEKQPVPVAADGRFEVTPELWPGMKLIQITATDPKSGRSYTENIPVELVSTPMPAVTDGMWDWTPDGWYPGAVIVRLGTGGKDLLELPATGKATWRLPMQQGTNNFDFVFLTGGGDTGFLHYRYDYSATARKVHMNLGKSKAQAGGKELDVPVPPQRIDDLTYVPLRFLGDSLGATVTWDDATQTATFVLGAKTVKVTLDSVDATVNGEHKAMVAPARLVNDRTLVPLRFISENLGAKVDWDEATEGITITLP